MLDKQNSSGESFWRQRFIESAEMMLKQTDGLLNVVETYEKWRKDLEQHREALLVQLKNAHDHEIDGLFNDGAECPDE